MHHKCVLLHQGLCTEYSIAETIRVWLIHPYDIRRLYLVVEAFEGFEIPVLAVNLKSLD